MTKAIQNAMAVDVKKLLAKDHFRNANDLQAYCEGAKIDTSNPTSPVYISICEVTGCKRASITIRRITYNHTFYN